MLAAIWCATTPAGAWERKYPPRYRYSSFGVWVKTNAPGYPAYRYTYRGAADGFPPPAYLYYGYPHSGDGSGIGF